jgi:hypothetical protein
MERHNIEIGNVFEVHNYMNSEPYIKGETQIIYLGQDEGLIDGLKYGNFVTVNNKKGQEGVHYFKRPMVIFLDFIDQGIYINKNESHISQKLLEDIRFNVDKQKESLNALVTEVQEKVQKEEPILTPEIKNEILSFFTNRKTPKEHYKGGNIKKKRKTRRSVKSKKSRKSRKTLKNV